MSRVRTTHSTIGECYQRRRKCAAVTPECSRTSRVETLSGREGIRTPDFCLRRGWDEIKKARLCRFFPAKANQAKCRKAQ